MSAGSAISGLPAAHVGLHSQQAGHSWGDAEPPLAARGRRGIWRSSGSAIKAIQRDFTSCQTFQVDCPVLLFAVQALQALNLKGLGSIESLQTG